MARTTNTYEQEHNQETPTNTPTNAQDNEPRCTPHCVHPEAVTAAQKQLPDHKQIEQASALLKLLADPTRLRILSALRDSELCVCDLSSVAGISESATSHQLRLLRTGKVVTYRKEGRVAYYHLLDDHVFKIIDNALEHVAH